MSRQRPDAPAERRISRLNWMEFAEWVPDPIATVLVPVGTLEAHGITSLGTDSELATRLAEVLADRLNAFVAPTIPYGVTAGLGALAGGTHVRADAFAGYVAAVATTLTHQGFRNIVVMNGHGGNNEALRDSLRQVHEETGAYVASFQWWTECYSICEEVFGAPGGHAGVDETAAMIAVAPDQVFADRWDPSLAFDVRPSLVTYPAPGSLLYFGGKRSDPVLDAKKARAFWNRVVEHSGEVLEDLVLRWEREGFPAPRPRRASGRGHVGHGGSVPGGGGNGHDKGSGGARKKNS
jgi:creatinine amidohydrolase